MIVKKIVSFLQNQLIAKWLVCRITSGRKSAQYGLRFSYPTYVLIVAIGIFLADFYVLVIAAIIAFLGIVLPVHPFDYIYNYLIVRLIGAKKIPGRGSELLVSSSVALIFNIVVINLVIYGIQLNYTILAFLYVAISAFFIMIQLSTNSFSFYFFYNFFKRYK